MTTAENLHTAFTLNDFSGHRMVDFPALYPVFINVFIWISTLKPLGFIPFVNAISFGLLLYLSGVILEQFKLPSNWYKRAILSCFVVSPCLLEIYSMVWSETLFILWLLLFFIALHRYFQSYSRLALAAVVAFAGLAAVTRYAGITVIGTGGLLLLLNTRLPWRRKFIDLFIYTLISPVLLVVNFWLNFQTTGTLTGNRERSLVGLHQNIKDAGEVFFNWLPFLSGQKGTVSIVILLLIFFGFIFGKHIYKGKRMGNYENIAACFSFFYLSFILVAASVSRFEQLNSRLLSPFFIPMILCFTQALLAIDKRFSILKNRSWVLPLLIFLSFQYKQLSMDYETWDGVKDAGIPGYTEDQWTLSSTVKFIKSDTSIFDKPYTIYSNASDAIYFFTKRQSKFLPHKEDLSGSSDFLHDLDCYVVWFNDGDNADLVGTDFILNQKKMKLFRQFLDGAVYIYRKD